MTRKLLCLTLLLLGDLVALGLWMWSLTWSSSPLDSLGARLEPLWLVPLIWGVCLAREGLYVRRHARFAEVRHVARATLTVLLTLFAFAQLELLVTPSARSLTLASIGAAATLIGVRRLLKPWLFERHLWRKEVLLVGVGMTGRRLIDALATDRFTGLAIVAALDDHPALQGGTLSGVPVLGGLEHLDEVLRQRQGRPPVDLLIAIPGLPRERLEALIKRAEGRVESIRFVPDLLGLSTVGVELESLRGTLAIRLNQNLMKPWNAVMKRLLDLTLALMLTLILLPVVMVVSLWIALETPGSPLLVQPRLGRRGQVFNCWNCLLYTSPSPRD